MKNESNDSANTPVSGENETLTRFESTTESEERWLPIPGYEGHYEVSNHGRVGSLKRGARKILSIAKSRRYWYAVLSSDGKPSTKLVHRLVLFAFDRPPLSGECACHNDGNTDNNNLSNLRWDSISGNMSDKIHHGTDNRGTRNHTARLNEDSVRHIRQRLSDGESALSLALTHGVSRAAVYDIKLGRSWRHCE